MVPAQRFPSRKDYRPPDLPQLHALAGIHSDLREAEVSDPRSDLDNRTGVRIFLYQRRIGGVLFERLVEPYDLGFYRRSDGKSTPFPSMRVRGLQQEWGFCRDIAAVRHDLDYYRGRPTRAEADRWYLVAQQALGESRYVALAEYLALRVAGWRAWNGHAGKRESIPGYGTDAHILQMPPIAGC